MTTTDCASCADERAAGAAFCEACGNQLTPTAPATTETATTETATTETATTETATTETAAIETAAVPATTGDPKTCPHCGTTGSVGADGYCENCGMLATRPRDHIEIDLPGAVAVTDRGRRHHRNEDSVWLTVRDGGIDAVVSDGVSASFDPDVASQTATDAAGAALTGGDGPGKLVFRSPEQHAEALAEHLSSSILEALAAVAELAHSGDPRRAVSNPACTIVAATVRNEYVDVGWVGDSRAYWLPADGPAEQLTEDDSWATHAIAMGTDPERALRDPKAHAITAWLGADAGPVRPRTAGFTVTAAGHLVLCSDGLWNYLPDPAVFGETVRAALTGRTLIEAARALVEHANTAGGADNITVVLIPVTPAASAAEPAEPIDKE